MHETGSETIWSIGELKATCDYACWHYEQDTMTLSSWSKGRQPMPIPTNNTHSYRVLGIFGVCGLYVRLSKEESLHSLIWQEEGHHISGIGWSRRGEVGRGHFMMKISDKKFCPPPHQTWWDHTILSPHPPFLLKPYSTETQCLQSSLTHKTINNCIHDSTIYRHNISLYYVMTHSGP